MTLVLAACHSRPITPLQGAARRGDTAAIHGLIAAGGDPNELDGHNGWTPLMHAIHKNQRRSVIALLDAGADPNARSRGGKTALMMAAGYGQTSIVRSLLARGADPTIELPNGDSALTAAIGGAFDIDRFTVGSCQPETVRALLQVSPGLRWRSTIAGQVSFLAARFGGCGDVVRMVEGRRRD